MSAVKLKGQITSDRKLRVKLPKDIAPGAVEVIVLHEAPPEPARTPKRRTRRKAAHPAFGLWAKREGISEPAQFAAQLRERVQSRRDRNGRR